MVESLEFRQVSAFSISIFELTQLTSLEFSRRSIIAYFVPAVDGFVWNSVKGKSINFYLMKCICGERKKVELI